MENGKSTEAITDLVIALAEKGDKRQTRTCLLLLADNELRELVAFMYYGRDVSVGNETSLEFMRQYVSGWERDWCITMLLEKMPFGHYLAEACRHSAGSAR